MINKKIINNKKKYRNFRNEITVKIKLHQREGKGKTQKIMQYQNEDATIPFIYDFRDKVIVDHLLDELCLANLIQKKFSRHILKYDFHWNLANPNYPMHSAL